MPISSQPQICTSNMTIPNLPLSRRAVSLKTGEKISGACGLPFKKRYNLGNTSFNNSHGEKDQQYLDKSIVKKLNISSPESCVNFYSEAINTTEHEEKPNCWKTNQKKDSGDISPVDFSLPDRIRAVRACKPKSNKIGSIIEAMWAKAVEREPDDAKVPLDLRDNKKSNRQDKLRIIEPSFDKQLPSENSALSAAVAANLADYTLLPTAQRPLLAPFDPLFYSIFSRLITERQMSAAAHSPPFVRCPEVGSDFSADSQLEPPLKRTRVQYRDETASDSTSDCSPSTTITSSTPSPKCSSDSSRSATVTDAGFSRNRASSQESEATSTNESAARYVINPVTGNRVRRTYKNMTVERRMEANARERDRVHTIGTAFDDLRKMLPNQKGIDQKLSKLSILRIACSYILLLGALNGKDYSAGCQGYTVKECLEMVTETLNNESKYKK